MSREKSIEKVLERNSTKTCPDIDELMEAQTIKKKEIIRKESIRMKNEE